MKKLTLRRKEQLTGYAFISLWLIGFILLTLYPLGRAIWLSFNTATFYQHSILTEFVFLDNFKYAFLSDELFPTICVDYFSSIIINVVFVISVSLFLAMLLIRNLKFRGFWRVIFFLPVIITSGPVMEELTNQGATAMHGLTSGEVFSFIENSLPTLISSPIIALFAQIITMLWFTGVPILIFVAALQRIDKSVYEASSIDGASSWQNFWKITLPSVKGFLFVNIVYTIVTISFFDTGTQSTGSYTIIAYIKKHAYGSSSTDKGFGYACALGIIFLLFILLQIGFYALVLLRERKVKRTYGK